MLYLIDSYLKECSASVVSLKDEKHIVLNRTVFYPKGGGQPCDTGKIIRGNEEFNVVSVSKSNGEILHEVDRSGLKVDEEVKCVLNWERRYRLMRSHTAAHVLAAVMNKNAGVLITGNQIEEDKVRFDFNLAAFDREFMERCVNEANAILQQDISLKIYELPRAEAMAIPGIVKLAGALPPQINILRIVEIPGIDIQADGGTHVGNVRECGQIELIKLENKGRDNRRIYFRLVP
ncbi:MAG: alanyl-tRNA editing protein AlaXM [Candidatus Bilamarchaeaceae archaeon]